MQETDDDLLLIAPAPAALTSFEFRALLESALGDNALYLRIRRGSKQPTGKYSAGGRNRLAALPKRGNFGIIPQERLMVLDFDTHRAKAASLAEQLSFFSELLGLDLSTTFAVVTPSGGLHVYLLLPEGVSGHSLNHFPKASLRGYSDAFSHVMGRSIVLDADMRSAKTTAYVVGPTSVVENGLEEEGTYWVADASIGFQESPTPTIAVVPQTGIDRIAEAVRWKQEKVVKDREAPALSTAVPRPDHAQDATGGPLFNTPPTALVLSELRAKLKHRAKATFHARRAFIKAALHCCYNDYAIALVCIDLGIAQDSHTQSEIPFHDLLLDVASFVPSDRYHSLYCPTGRKVHREEVARRQKAAERKSTQVFHLASYEEHNKRLVEERRLPRLDLPFRPANHRVLDIPKIESKLQDALPRGPKSQQYRDALAVVDFFLHPLANVGARKMVLALAALQEHLSLTPSRASQALRILRREGIVVIVDRQRTGLATTYQVEEEYTHRLLTKYLRSSWAAYGEERGSTTPIYLDRFTGDFREVLTGRLVPVPDRVTRKLATLGQAPDNTGAGAAHRYLTRVKADPYPSQRGRGAELAHGEELLAVRGGGLGKAVPAVAEARDTPSAEEVSAARDVKVPRAQSSVTPEAAAEELTALQKEHRQLPRSVAPPGLKPRTPFDMVARGVIQWRHTLLPVRSLYVDSHQSDRPHSRCEDSS
jgi:DNA-binding transcriptional ArsR family regulator